MKRVVWVALMVWYGGWLCLSQAVAFQRSNTHWAYVPHPMGEDWRICPEGMPGEAVQRTKDGAAAWNYEKFQFTFGTEACLSDAMYPNGNSINQIDFGAGLAPGVLAQTTHFFFTNAPDQTIECDMRFNNTIDWYTGTGTPGINQFDWWSVAAHEMGHCLGLDHEVNLTPPPVMDPLIANGEIRRQLTADDRAGRDAIYGPETVVCVLPGEVTGDQRITPRDALRTFQHFLGLANPPLSAVELLCANVFNPQENAITPADALCIFRKFLGLASCLD